MVYGMKTYKGQYAGMVCRHGYTSRIARYIARVQTYPKPYPKNNTKSTKNNTKSTKNNTKSDFLYCFFCDFVLFSGGTVYGYAFLGTGTIKGYGVGVRVQICVRLRAVPFYHHI